VVFERHKLFITTIQIILYKRPTSNKQGKQN
jgi:hypothetical protein